MLDIDHALAARTSSDFYSALCRYPETVRDTALEKRRAIVFLRQCAEMHANAGNDDDATLCERRADDLEFELERYLKRRCTYFDARTGARQ